MSSGAVRTSSIEPSGTERVRVQVREPARWVDEGEDEDEGPPGPCARGAIGARSTHGRERANRRAGTSGTRGPHGPRRAREKLPAMGCRLRNVTFSRRRRWRRWLLPMPPATARPPSPQDRPDRPPVLLLPDQAAHGFEETNHAVLVLPTISIPSEDGRI
ncbi:PREDICTED: uncharacterized protein LOC108746864 [Trachymyrmex septentrionalis]|uniref:uncharacterized protein LOC108746864 n=1 Tax=Trachymyrmex septentrionalis TaxID=34720 RepID=UPI00084F743C|nr:PREDICTED: uncharacterized protein LOC108746864 [Trachymyrmex septentrionalis]